MTTQTTRAVSQFSDHARDVVRNMQEEARSFGHTAIGPEHLLLALQRDTDCMAARVLSAMNVDQANVRIAIETIAGRSDAKPGGELGLTARNKRVIELAFEEAGRLSSPALATEHLLLGIFLDG